MTYRLGLDRFAPSILLICIFLPGRGAAQDAAAPVKPGDPGTAPTAGPGGGGCSGPGGCDPSVNGPGAGYYGPGPRYGKKAHIYPPPGWIYPGLPGGPSITTAYPFAGWPGYRGAAGPLWWQALHLTGPQVPVYTPIPDFVETCEAVNHWQNRKYIFLGIGYTGWIGTFRASPRPKPPSVSAWPALGPGPGSVAPNGGRSHGGSCLVVEVKVPHSGTEVFVDGTRTAQSGTDRVYESPPLEPGKDCTYELTARWVENGATVERKQVVTGKPGEVVRIEFSASDTVQTRR